MIWIVQVALPCQLLNVTASFFFSHYSSEERSRMKTLTKLRQGMLAGLAGA